MPFEVEPCTSYNLSQEERDSLLTQVETVNQSLLALEAQTEMAPEVP